MGEIFKKKLVFHPRRNGRSRKSSVHLAHQWTLAWHCFRHWRYRREQSKQKPLPSWNFLWGEEKAINRERKTGNSRWSWGDLREGWGSSTAEVSWDPIWRDIGARSSLQSQDQAEEAMRTEALSSTSQAHMRGGEKAAWPRRWHWEADSSPLQWPS